MNVSDRIDDILDCKHDTRLEILRKMDINKLKSSDTSVDARYWLERMKNSRVGADKVFDSALKAVTKNGVEALVWITQDDFCRDNYCVRVVPLLRNNMDVNFWLELISVVHSSRREAVSISWFVGPEQTAAQEALTRWNYRFVSCLRAEMTEADNMRRKDSCLYRTDALLRPDIGTSFVSFKFGWLAISGTNKGISKIDFIRTGSQLTDIIMSVHAQYLGLLDEYGRVLVSDGIGIMAKDVEMQVPQPVIKAAAQLKEYLAGQRKSFELELLQDNYSNFQKRVWEEICNVPYGVTATYEDLAIKLSSPGQKAHSLARAVGTACASNPLPLVVPCHRIIGKNGRLTGFNGGVDIKEYLLNHEVFGVE